MIDGGKDLSAVVESWDANADASGDWTKSVSLPDDACAGAEVEPNSVDALSRLAPVAYQRRRKSAAKLLEMGVRDLDGACRAEQAKRRHRAQEADRRAGRPEPGTTKWPPGFQMRATGLFAEEAEGANDLWLCGPFEVLGEARDAEGESWSLHLRWTDADGHPHQWAMPKRLLMVQPGELEACMVDRGLAVAPNPTARTRLRDALSSVRTGNRFMLVSHPGWHAPAGGNAAFALANGETIGRTPESLVLKDRPDKAHHTMTPAGTLEGWQRSVAATAQGNPIAVFALSMAFAGPLLDPLGESSGGFHIYGRSKAGKTLIVKLALSVWGQPNKSGLLRDWRSTANALEATAEQCCDGLLPLDEVHQADPREVVSAVYTLANEAGKSRLKRDAASRPKRTWRTIILSTGEVDLAAIAAKAGHKMPAGAEVRVPCIPIDASTMWPALHGSAGPTELMADLQVAVSQNHGVALRPYLEWLSAVRRDHGDKLEQKAAEIRQQFDSLLPVGSDPQVRDVARRCALVALAGELATQRKILPWQKGEATQAAEAVLRLWLERRGNSGSTEEIQHIRAVRSFIAEYGLSRFVRLERSTDGRRWVERDPERQIISRAGFRRRNDNQTDVEEYLIPADAWRELCNKAGIDPIECAKTLDKVGLLEKPGDGRNRMKSENLPKIGKTRVYLVKPAIFGTGDECDGC